MSDTNQTRMMRMGMKLSAASMFYASRMQDFEASLMVGQAKEREAARVGVLGGLEALLDAKAEQAKLQIEVMGLDPEKRSDPV